LATAFFVHARSDRDCAAQLAEFLELGCNLTCFVEDGLIGEGKDDLIAKAEEGLCSDVLVLLLSPASCPARWLREQWERVLFDQPTQSGVDIVTVLLKECSFPALLRRRNFVDGTTNWRTARRLLKRWFWLREREPGTPPSSVFSEDLEDLYLALADRSGALPVSGDAASRFAREGAEEFEAVLWVPCQGRTLAQASGELARQLSLTLEGPAEENCRCIRDVLSRHRCLVVLDAAGAEIGEKLTAGGRASTIVTREAVTTVKTPETLAFARSLIAAQRYAEAYELLYRLLDAVIDPESCARELTWICERWDRIEEANVLRSNYGPPGEEQLALF
jgi:hypothetical protein